jgi:hypothetical protein
MKLENYFQKLLPDHFEVSQEEVYFEMQMVPPQPRYLQNKIAK